MAYNRGQEYAMSGKEREAVASSARAQAAIEHRVTAVEDDAMCSTLLPSTLMHESQKHAERWSGYKHDGLVLRCPPFVQARLARNRRPCAICNVA